MLESISSCTIESNLSYPIALNNNIIEAYTVIVIVTVHASLEKGMGGREGTRSRSRLMPQSTVKQNVRN